MKDGRGCLVGLGLVLLVTFGPLLYVAITTNLWRNP